MSLPPPPALQVGTYLKNAQVGLGKMASWNYPYAIIKADTWTCVSYQTTDAAGNTVTILTTPDIYTQSDHYYPEWVKTIDYSLPASKPWVPWKVRHNGLYYEPSCWLTSTHAGKTPSTAEAGVGDRLNVEFQTYSDLVKKEEVCRNQSHPIRAWLSLGTLEDDNGWNNALDFNSPDPISGEVRRQHIPISFEQRVDDPKQHGGDWYGDYSEEYYPKLTEPVKWVNDPERAALYATTNMAQFYAPSTFLKRFNEKTVNGQFSNDEPQSWDFMTGKMATLDIMSTSGYDIMSSSLGGFTAYLQRGISINLWRQKIIVKTSRVKVTSPDGFGGTSTRYKLKYEQTASDSPMAAAKTMMVCSNPGPGFATDFFLYGAVFNYLEIVPDGTPTSNNFNFSQKYKLFAQSRHPVVFTRKFFWYESTETNSRVETKVLYPGSDPPSYVYRETSRTDKMSYDKKEFTPSYNQLAYSIQQLDPAGGSYTSVDANKVGTFVYSTTYSGGSHSSTNTVKNLYTYGAQYVSD